MCEPNRNMPLQSLSRAPSLSTSPSTPKSLLHPNSPEISNGYSPELRRRMQGDTCYRCRKQGHWSWHCPLNSPNSTSSLSPTAIPRIWCRCGHGFCEVKTSGSLRNPGRKYYACPIKRGKRCKDFVKWCDDRIEESDLQPPPYKYPQCECGAGVCRKVKATDADKYYFACPVGEAHGSCGYCVWEDELLDNKSIVPIQQSSQRTLHDLWERCQKDKTDDDLDKGGDLLIEQHSKRMRIMDNTENQSSMAAAELPQRENAVLMAAPPKHVGFPEFKVADDPQDLEFANSVSCDAIQEEAFPLSHLSTPSRIRNRQNVFQRHIFACAVADASFGPCPVGWLGRLLFFHPAQSLKSPPPQPFFCCVFPSFNPIVVPKQASSHDGSCGECNQLAVSNLSQHAQFLTSCHTEVLSRDVVSSNKSPGRERKPTSKAERQKQVVLFAQQQLLSDLETMDPHEHESMREAAEATFAVLDRLAVDYKHFAELVWDFVNYTSSVVEIGKSLENFLSTEEYNQRYEEEKVKFANIRDDYVKTKALLEVSNQHTQSLREEVSHLEAMLHEKQNQFNSCELETLKIDTKLGDINRSMLEADTTLKVTAEQAEVARKLNEERQERQIAAKTALEKAKFELEN